METQLQGSISLSQTDPRKIHWVVSTPFFLMHLMPFGVFFVETHWLRDLTICFVLYYVRMFFITGGYHRYFAHRSYKMNRVMQFLMAVGGSMAAQKGVLWWAAHHRHHHKYSDMPEDVHSPKKGLWWSHVGWILSTQYEDTRTDLIPDFAKYPELRFLNKYHLLPPIALGIAIYFIFGASALFIGFFLSTVLLYHGTFCINSLTHMIGNRRYATSDSSRNSMILALITCGEGWHNNHHHYQACANQGFFWWEIDLSYYTLKGLEALGLVQDVRHSPLKAKQRRMLSDGHADIGMFQIHFEKAMRALANATHSKGVIHEEKRHAINLLLHSTLTKAEEIARISEPKAAKAAGD